MENDITMSTFGNLKIGARLSLGFGTLILLGLIAAGVGIERIRAVNTIADQLGSDDAEMLVLTQRWTRAIESNAARTWVVFFAADPQVLKRVKDEMQETINSNSVRIKRMGELASSAEKSN